MHEADGRLRLRSAPSLSCAAAVDVARLGFRTLLLTTDPAAHIGHVLGQVVTDVPVPVNDVPHLLASRSS